MNARPADARLLLGFPDYRAPAARLARRTGCSYADIAVHRFPDGESRVCLPAELPEQVILFTSLDRPNERLVELELAAATAPELGAKRLTLVAPYLCYMRQDRAFHPGEAVSQHIIGRLLARHFDTVITVDPHLHRTHRLQDALPVRQAVAVSAAPAMARWLLAHADHPFLLGPDEESEQWLRAIAEPLGLDYAVARKQREGDRDVRVQLPEAGFASRDVVLIDDMASTGQTLTEAARTLRARGAASVTVLVSHALFVGDALAQMHEAGIGTVYSTDSIAHPSNAIPLDGLLAEALQSG